MTGLSELWAGVYSGVRWASFGTSNKLGVPFSPPLDSIINGGDKGVSDCRFDHLSIPTCLSIRLHLAPALALAVEGD